MSKIFVVMGKSASGKDTIFQELSKRLKSEVKTFVGYTTRPIRSGEENGREYYFVDTETLKQLTKEGKVIECRNYNTVHGIWSYFTVDDGQIDLKHNDYIFIGTLEAYNQMKAYFGSEALSPIYVEVEPGERLKRALKREEKQEIPKYAELCRRYLADEEDFSDEKLVESGVQKRYQNQCLDQCIEEILTDIRLEIQK